MLILESTCVRCVCVRVCVGSVCECFRSGFACAVWRCLYWLYLWGQWVIPRQLTRIEIQSLSIHQKLKDVTLFLKILRFTQRRNQLLYFCIRKIGIRTMALNENFWHCYFKFVVRCVDGI